MIIAPDVPQDWEETARAFTAAVQSGRLDLPLPGHGRTRVRWAALAGIAEHDLSLARLAEGHADAIAILDELGGPPPPPGSRWGGTPAKPVRTWFRELTTLARLAERSGKAPADDEA